MFSSEYEELSIGILNQCQEDNDEQTQKILIREQPSFGKLTCIDLAVVADSKRFIAQTGCQSLLTSIWMGRMQPYNSMFKVVYHLSRVTFERLMMSCDSICCVLQFVLALFCPPLILFLIYFTNDKVPEDSNGARSANKKDKVAGANGDARELVMQDTRMMMTQLGDDTDVHIGQTGARLTPFSRLVKFYSAPITKFSINFVSTTLQ